ncbi:MAG: class I SAM-dependent methyltransferase [Candidatus Kariarchaeaceae archaeon]|jgi:magnesium-protoporphyrin O-methyltransferase
MADSEVNSSKNKALYLPNWYKDEAKPVKLSSFGWTAKLHVEKITHAQAKSVYDIGCGAAGILLALQEQNVKILHGIDASPEAIDLAKTRFSKFGTLDNVSLSVGDGATVAAPNVDAVSLHRVVCCYPDAIGLLSKAVETKPKMLMLTFPRDRWFVRIVTFLENLGLRTVAMFKRTLRGRHSFVHDPKLIDKELRLLGYNRSFEKKGVYWLTMVYELDIS